MSTTEVANQSGTPTPQTSPPPTTPTQPPPTPAPPATPPSHCSASDDPVKKLKDCLEALEKLKLIRKELKTKLSKEGLSDEDESNFATDLATISKSIKKLETKKIHLAAATAADPVPA